MNRTIPPLVAVALLISSCGQSVLPSGAGTPEGNVGPADLGGPTLSAQQYGALSGVFVPGAPTGNAGMNALDTWSGNVGGRARQVMWYSDWATDFQAYAVTNAYSRGATPVVTWEMYGKRGAAIRYADVLAGRWNTYIDRWADAARADGRTVLVRLGHEMNGDWYPWSGAQNGGTAAPENYVKMWRFVHDRFVARGAVNVRWVWTPNNVSTPNEAWNAPASYYPGDAYVDWVGADGYNFGTSQRISTGASFDSRWQTFDEVFADIYARVTAVAPTKPFMIGEFACSEIGGNKAAWIADAAARIRAYPAIQSWVWFNQNKETDWRVESSPTALAAFRSAFGDPAAFAWTGP
ncbi:glycoside hydrolase family 26 protein [Deinococcus pimensis]|uniref:glycoside hydrolase family 26 protein n=1 Tax=Deinococcus pimensis TaxID=309888 RepID=UPI0004AF311F|nr:glycosyl hydrolase [Deinococcus pimensis]